jgi:uncharacterized glyoxalase superfamily protein PhnB
MRKGVMNPYLSFNGQCGKDGRVVLPLEKTFWAARFGMVVDRFGIPWLINCERSDQLREG